MPELYNKCILYKGKSRYDVVRCFIDEMAHSFAELGYEPLIFDFVSDKIDTLYNYINEGVDFIVTFDSLAVEMEYDNKPLYDFANTPLVSILVDAPLYGHNRLSVEVDNLITTCVDKNHIPYIKMNYFNKNCAFLPHGGSSAKNRKDMDKRETDILFCGSYSDSIDEIAQLLNLKYCSEVRHMFYSLLDLMVNDEKLSITDAINKFFGDKNYYPNDKFFADNRPLFMRVEGLLREINRNKVIEAALSSGATLKCFGSGWDKSTFYGRENFIYGGEINYFDAVEEMGNAKICLNTVPTFKNGAHERIFSSMLSGAVCVTDENVYLKEIFTDNEDLVFYTYKELELLPQKITSLLGDPAKLSYIAENGYRKACESHTWKHRAQEVINLVNLIFPKK